MAVQFILGRSGFGKTSRCIEEIIENLLEDSAESLILLVPAQATYQAERTILNEGRIAGYSRLHILSFERLAYMLYGKNTAIQQISPIGQEMVVHKILKQNADKFSVFASSATQQGLAGEVTRIIIELQRYSQGPEDIDNLIKAFEKYNVSNSVRLKFSDIRLVFQEYLNFIESRFANPDTQLNMACRKIADTNFIKGAKLWVDGFSGFTTQELQMLAEMLKTAHQSRIALCIDPAKLNIKYPETVEPDPTSLFYPTEKTYKELVELIRRCKLPIAEAIILEKSLRFSAAPALSHIEQNVFGDTSKTKIPAGENVSIASAANALGEVKYAARQIQNLVRNKNCRFRDIAIVASDIKNYQHYLEAILTDYGIPFFIDHRKSLQQYPVVELLCSAIATAVGDISNDDVFGYLKSDLVGPDRYEIDLLENYCIAFGIDSNDWMSSDNWHFAGASDKSFDEEQINNIRRKAMVHLLNLRNRLTDSSNITSEKFRDVIFEFLENLQIRQKLQELTAQALEENELEHARRHCQVWDSLVKIFDELIEIFPVMKMSVADYASIMNSALSRLSLAIIPPRLDEVLVGSIERSRHPDLKAIFLIGASQKQFPVPLPSESVLTDDDRNCAAGQDFILAETTVQQLSARRYLSYIAFTRPSRYLYITYPLADDRGASLAPSQFLSELQELFTDVKPQIPHYDIDLSQIYNTAELADRLCEQIDSRDDLLKQMRAEPLLAKTACLVDSTINYTNTASLKAEFIKSHLPDTLTCSATQLATFAACPYKYFARYNLKLRERQIFTFETLDLGNFYHGVLEKFFTVLRANNTNLAEASDNQVSKYLTKAAEDFISKNAFTINFRKRGRHNIYIITSACEILQDFVIASAKMARAGVFRQVAAELSFGSEAGLDGYKITLANGKKVLLRGKIDRLDIAEIDGKPAAIIFDYKTGNATVDFTKIFYGLNLQLPVYLLAINGKNFAGTGPMNVAGAFNIPIQVNPPLTVLNEIDRGKNEFRHKAKGIFDGEVYNFIDNQTESGWSRYYNFYISKKSFEPFGNYNYSGAFRPEDFQKLLNFAEAKIKSIAGQIYDGKIEIRPYQGSCLYCPYKALCRFDWQVNDQPIPLDSVSKTQLLAAAGDDDGC